MTLSLKAVRFVIEALEHLQLEHDQRLADKGLSEDESADLTNDRKYLDSIKRDFEKHRDELTRNRENVSVG